MTPFSLNIRGRLLQYDRPAVMGIINVTPDSFYGQSRAVAEDQVAKMAEQMLSEGADFIDIGAYSTRPGHAEVTADEELRRLEIGLSAVRKVSADVPVSVDTFRASVAREAVTNLSVDIINDISGGKADPDMMPTVAELKAPYVLMHMRGTPSTSHCCEVYDNLLVDVLTDLAQSIDKLSLLGVNDVIVDPGFGFSKDLEQNYILLRHLSAFQIFHLPVLVGVSRKSMVTKLLGVPASEALEGTTALHMAALQRGAAILRVHDVKAAKQAIEIYNHI